MKGLMRLIGVFAMLSIARPTFAFDNCVIIARRSTLAGVLTKWYSCKQGVVSLTGAWSQQTEFDIWTWGERADFGTPPAKVSAAFTKCVVAQEGGCGNCDGYMTMRAVFDCAEGKLTLRGQWGEEYQGHWNYHLELGEVTSQPQWVDDPKKNIDFVSSFQKWCPTQHGFRLCGWVEEPKVDHGTPPAFKR